MHTLDDHQKMRLRATLRGMWYVPVMGAVYAGFVLLTGLAIPCPIRLVTGLKCPGCGITTCLLSLIRLDFHAAFHANPLVFCLLLQAACYWLYRTRRYVLYDSDSVTVPEAAVLTIVFLITIGFGIARNLPAEVLAQFM